MAFLIPDNLRSRHEVPAPLRRVATALRNGLDDEAIVWFEPLFDVAGTKPHFVVLIPDNGIGVLEVLDVPANSLLGTVRGQLRLERDGVEVEVAQPLARADAFAATLRERIRTEPRLTGLTIPVASAAVFPRLERSDAAEKGLPKAIEFERCFFRTDIEDAVAGDASARSLHRGLARLLGSAAPIDEEEINVLRGLVQPQIVIDSPDDDEQLAIFRPPVGQDLMRVMDQQQEALAKSMGEGHRVVRGVAGSGKTLILVYRAKLFARLFPQHRFLLTCYTRSLASVLRMYLGGYDNVDVQPLHTLMGRAIRAAELGDPRYSGDPTGEERARVALQALARGSLPRYRAVFVDEAQDFGPKALRFAASLADERFNDVLIVADAAQNVFRQRFSWKEAGIQAQGRTRILRRNYRNTREILELAHGFLVPEGSEITAVDLEDETAIVPPEAAVRQGPLPTLVTCAGKQLIDTVIEEARRHLDERAGPKTLALLTMGNREAIDLERRLRREKISFFFATDPQRDANRDKIAEALEPVVLSTVYSAKGLEFPRVVLCGAPREGQPLDELRSTLYVGMTRATERLTVVVAKDNPLADDLRKAAEQRGRLRMATP